MTQNLGCARWRYLGVVMNNSLSFRKESIQMSSSESAGLRHSLAGLMRDQGPRNAGDKWVPILTTSFTVTE